MEAARNLLDALPKTNTMAFILVQHLDPTHKSMMVELLASHTGMTVVDAANGMALAGNHLYVNPPGKYLAVSGGTLHLTVPTVHHGARLPIDFLLQSLARDYGARAACIILSGTGFDGSIGTQAIKTSGGLVIAQDPDETAYDGMARSAIATGVVDHVLRIIDMPQVLAQFGSVTAHVGSWHAAADDTPSTGPASLISSQDWLDRVIELIRAKTAHDFTLYKLGTLQRRIERRMALVALKPKETAIYLTMLMDNPAELELLATDLLINVTSFDAALRAYGRRGLYLFRLRHEQHREPYRDRPLGELPKVWSGLWKIATIAVQQSVDT